MASRPNGPNTITELLWACKHIVAGRRGLLGGPQQLVAGARRGQTWVQSLHQVYVEVGVRSKDPGSSPPQFPESDIQVAQRTRLRRREGLGNPG